MVLTVISDDENFRTVTLQQNNKWWLLSMITVKIPKKIDLALQVSFDYDPRGNTTVMSWMSVQRLVDADTGEVLADVTTVHLSNINGWNRNIHIVDGGGNHITKDPFPTGPEPTTFITPGEEAPILDPTPEPEFIPIPVADSTVTTTDANTTGILTIKTETDAGEPIPGAQVGINADQGVTNATGEFSASVTVNDTANIQVMMPSGYLILPGGLSDFVLFDQFFGGSTTITILAMQIIEEAPTGDPGPVDTTKSIQIPPGGFPEAPPTLQTHEITIFFRNPFGLGQKMAIKAGEQQQRIQALMPSTITYTHYTTTSESVTLYFTEEGENLIVTATIIAIVAVLVALLAVLVVGWVYKENQIVKETLVVQQEGIAKIADCLNDKALSEDEKIECAKEILGGIPTVALPPEGEGLGGLLGGIKTATNIIPWVIAGGALLLALKKR